MVASIWVTVFAVASQHQEKIVLDRGRPGGPHAEPDCQQGSDGGPAPGSWFCRRARAYRPSMRRACAISGRGLSAELVCSITRWAKTAAFLASPARSADCMAPVNVR